MSNHTAPRTSTVYVGRQHGAGSVAAVLVCLAVLLGGAASAGKWLEVQCPVEAGLAQVCTATADLPLLGR